MFRRFRSKAAAAATLRRTRRNWRLPRILDPEPATSVSAKIFTLDLTNPAAKPVTVSNSPGGNFNPAYSPDGKYLAWRSEARAGYESDKFRLFLYDRAAKTIKDLLPKFDNWVDEFAWAPDSKIDLFCDRSKGEVAHLWSTNDRWASRITSRQSGEFSDLQSSHPRAMDHRNCMSVHAVRIKPA